MLKTLTAKNLTVFPEANLKFAPGLNVIVGENGCGKSHLLKVAYAVMAASSEEGKKPTASEPTKTVLQKVLADKLINVMRPESLGRLARRKHGRERCELGLTFSDSKLNCEFSFATSSKSEVQVDTLPKAWQVKAPVFLPTRELLSIYPNFVAVYESHDLEFEETYRDTCLLLGALALKGAREKQASAILEPLEQAMGGSVVLEKTGRFYLRIPGQGNMEMPLVAEGLRKLAMIARLVSTGSLLDKGSLFWDEPETNLNPRLIRLVAKVIYLLCQQGIQVFVATHSLFLLRELEILSTQEQFSDVEHRYFALKPADDGVEIEQGDALDELSTLVLLDEELAQSDRFLEGV